MSPGLNQLVCANNATTSMATTGYASANFNDIMMPPPAKAKTAVKSGDARNSETVWRKVAETLELTGRDFRRRNVSRIGMTL
jgi:hypothetical protein